MPLPVYLVEEDRKPLWFATRAHIRTSRLVMMSLVLKVQKILQLSGYHDNDSRLLFLLCTDIVMDGHPTGPLLMKHDELF